MSQMSFPIQIFDKKMYPSITILPEKLSVCFNSIPILLCLSQKLSDRPSVNPLPLKSVHPKVCQSVTSDTIPLNTLLQKQV